MSNTEKWESPETDSLVDALLSLKSPREVRNFLRDLLTEQELLEFGRRWKAARMLHEHTPYSAIENETGLSSTTVARISKWLNHGTGGYQLVLERMRGKKRQMPVSKKLENSK